MKILVNCSGLSRGGVIQASKSFLEYCKEKDKHYYLVVIKESLSHYFEIETFPANFQFFFIKQSPIKSLKSVCKLRQIESITKPDVVFTPFGMSFWKPKSPHLIGFALPFLVYPESVFFKMHKPTLRSKFEKILKLYLVKMTAQYIYVENEDIKERLVKLYGFDANEIYNVPGAYNQIYDKPMTPNKLLLPPKDFNEFRFITISPFFKHKNLSIIREIVLLLKERNLVNIRFVLTIDPLDFSQNFDDVKDQVINVGPVRLEDCPYLYSECDATFMPTLLESFTAIYPDSMKMGKPIVTSNLGFATTVCDNAALYFEPASASDALSKILDVVNSKELYNRLVDNCVKRINNMPKAKDRAEHYFRIFDFMLSEHKKNN